jgi:hypothetical protein
MVILTVRLSLPVSHSMTQAAHVCEFTKELTLESIAPIADERIETAGAPHRPAGDNHGTRRFLPRDTI